MKCCYRNRVFINFPAKTGDVIDTNSFTWKMLGEKTEELRRGADKF
jgi:hypothetical protein